MRKNGKNTPKSTLSKVLTLLRGKRALVSLSILLALIVDGSRKASGDAVNVVFAQLGMNLELVEYFDFGNVRV